MHFINESYAFNDTHISTACLIINRTTSSIPHVSTAELNELTGFDGRPGGCHSRFTQAPPRTHTGRPQAMRACSAWRWWHRQKGLCRGGYTETVRNETPLTPTEPTTLPRASAANPRSKESRVWLQKIRLMRRGRRREECHSAWSFHGKRRAVADRRGRTVRERRPPFSPAAFHLSIFKLAAVPWRAGALWWSPAFLRARPRSDRPSQQLGRAPGVDI